MAQPQKSSDEKIQLLRGNSVVSSLAGAFGGALRETRLTALLGYLVALKPDRFCREFGFQGAPTSVALETRHATDRSDILVKTTLGSGIIEAKVGAHDPFEQALKYTPDWLILLTEHQPTRSQRSIHNCKYMRWRDLVPLLDELSKSADAPVRFLSNDLKLYLEEHQMIPAREAVEVYAREINEEKTLALFLHARMYGCKFEASSQLPKAQYFAPHFGQAIAANHPGVHVGISYVARIENVVVVESYGDLCDAAKQLRGRNWFTKNSKLIEPVRSWPWTDSRQSFVFLGPPRLIFNPPIKKETLQAGKGWLSKRTFSFDELFEKWGC